MSANSLHIETTTRCILACPACPRTTWHDILKKPVSKEDLDVDLLEKFLDCPGGKTFNKFILCGDYGDSILMRMKSRMEGINAPELNTPEGVVAKEDLTKIIDHRVVKCRLGGYDKYGRVLVSILDEDEALKKHLEKHILP